MRNFVIGFICGAIIVGTAWAAQRCVLVDGSGNEIGKTGSPVYISGA